MRTFQVVRHEPNRVGPEDVIRLRRAETGRVPRVLNVGSSGVRFDGCECVNFDVVQKGDVDVVGDAHDLAVHFDAGEFDVVVVNAVLQYCARPSAVLHQARYVLRRGGLLYLDVPFMQPYCEDQPDLWRFTEAGIRRLAEPLFEDVRSGVSIAGASALAFYVEKLLDVGPRPVSYALRLLASIPMSVFARTQFNKSPEVAGAFWLTGRKG